MAVEIVLCSRQKQVLTKHCNGQREIASKKNLETGTNLLEIFQFTYTFSKVK